MNNLINHEFHETIGNIIKVEVNDDIRKGQELSQRIPYNYISEMENNFKSITEDNPLGMNEEDLIKLIPRLNFNLPESNYRLMEKTLIENQDYFNLFDLFSTYDIYKNMNKFTLYSYCRNLCNKPILEKEYKKINQDLKLIKKSMKQINKKQLKKNTGKYNIVF